MRSGHAAVVVLLALLALASVPAAVITDSYVPLFLAWVPQGLILVFLSRVDRSAAPSATAATPARVAEPPHDDGG
jgi:integral membrane sensor domain MASE1